MYLDYDSYAQMGGELDPDVYERLTAKAERLIDRATHARLKAQASVPMCVKYCIMELIDAIQADESMGSMSAGREISSMSNDGVSVSFAASGATRLLVLLDTTRIFTPSARISSSHSGTPLSAQGFPCIESVLSISRTSAVTPFFSRNSLFIDKTFFK